MKRIPVIVADMLRLKALYRRDEAILEVQLWDEIMKIDGTTDPASE